MSRKSLPVLYSCARCPAYCCSYARIGVNKRDLRRLAKHFGITVEAAKRRFTKAGDDPGEVVLRHQRDEHFGTVCRFLSQDDRLCTIYAARPEICRAFPSTARCGYYDFLAFERRTQNDPEWIATTYNKP